MSQADRPKPYSPHGACDGCVVDSVMAKNMSFSCRFGNSCGIPFNNTEFFDKHIQWNSFRPYVFDRPTQPWTVFTITNKYGSVKRLLTKKNKNKNKLNTKNKTKIRKTDSGKEDESGLF